MRVVLDENVPVELADELPDHEVVHVKDLGWKGIGNGEFLRRADEAGFEALITAIVICPISRTWQASTSRSFSSDRRGSLWIRCGQ